MPNHALQRTAAVLRGCNRRVSWAGSLSLRCSAARTDTIHRLLCFALCVLAGTPSAGAEPPAKSESVTHYDPAPAHLWNRLHAALLIRPNGDGKTIGHDDVDPAVFPTTKRLLEGPTHAEAVKLLDEFLADGHKLVHDPVKRAVMQRDLWAVFDWAVYPHGNYYTSDTSGEPVAIRTGPLQKRLAKAIRILAPSAAEAEKLPDTYALAVKAKAFPAAFDPAKPNAPFLPPDLFDADGQWVCVTGPKGMSTPVAAMHAGQSAGRSVFLVFIRLPEGRKETLAYLDTLNTFPKPWAVPPEEPDDSGRRPSRGNLNPDVPQFPPGTQVALVRQMVVATEGRKPVATPLVESVQLRTYREIRPREKDFSNAEKTQGFVELKFRRADLFAGTAGGLHAVEGDAMVSPALTLFGSYADPFESKGDDIHNRPQRAFALCADCHSPGGIRGVNSYTQFGAAHPTRALGLFPITVADARARATGWKTGLKDWAELKKLCEW
jgi:hypothetical protein